MNNFWQKLKKPFFCLAPMEDVTDTAFRQMVINAGRPDVVFTEFVNTDALNSIGADNVKHRLVYKKNEHPIVAQIWGAKPENYYNAVKLVKELGFDGVDINMACPVKKIIKTGACSSLIKNPSLAKEIIIAMKEASNKDGKPIPVSVKTRIGFNKIQTDEWISFLLSMDLDALTIHGRTKKENKKSSANWEEIGKAVKMRDEMGSKTIIIGNGDIKSRAQGLSMAEKYGVDGVMIARGIFNNLFVFKGEEFEELTTSEKIKYALKHLDLYQKIWGISKGFPAFKKYFRIYITGFRGASELRTSLMEAKSNSDAKKILKRFLDDVLD